QECGSEPDPTDDPRSLRQLASVKNNKDMCLPLKILHSLYGTNSVSKLSLNYLFHHSHLFSYFIHIECWHSQKKKKGRIVQGFDAEMFRSLKPRANHCFLHKLSYRAQLWMSLPKRHFLLYSHQKAIRTCVLEQRGQYCYHIYSSRA
ncbi:unnamed protein product, partial [Bubo scandiacus]